MDETLLTFSQTKQTHSDCDFAWFTQKHQYVVGEYLEEEKRTIWVFSRNIMV